MNRRQRKLLGGIAMLLFVVVYALAIAALATTRLPTMAWWGQVLFYAAAGLGWTLPLFPLIRWMERGPTD